jgi:flagellar basal-body rod modification protein FlgD
MAVTQAIDSDGNLIQSQNYYNSTSSTTSSNDTLDKDAFLQLLVAEMQYQDPLEPSSNTDYIAQLATFSQVESMNNMQLTYQQSQGADLVGKAVIMKTESSSGESGYICGRVDYMVTENSKVYLSINGSLYDIDDLDTVLEEDYYQTTVLGKDSSASTDAATVSDSDIDKLVEDN